MPAPTTSDTDAAPNRTDGSRATRGRLGAPGSPKDPTARPGAARSRLARLADGPLGTARVATWGIAAIVAILAIAAAFLLATLPSADAFDARVERLFVEADLRANAELRLLEILAQSGRAFADTLAGYRVAIFVLLVFSAALLVTALIFLVVILALQRRIGEIERAGIRVGSLLISRETNTVWLNDTELTLTEAAIETLSVLAEARMDDEILSGSEIEAVISGRDPSDCDEASGATRIKRLRDGLGNQIVTALLIRTVARRGYTLSVDPAAIRMV